MACVLLPAGSYHKLYIVEKLSKFDHFLCILHLLLCISTYLKLRMERWITSIQIYRYLMDAAY